MIDDLTDERLASMINSLMIDKASYERELSNHLATAEHFRESIRRNKLELLPLQREAARRWGVKDSPQ